MSAQNPFGLHTVTPYLMLKNVEKLISFLQNVFNAEIRGELSKREDGSVQHAEIKIGDSVIMMGEPMEAFEANAVGLYVYVKDCDKVYQKALEEGAVSLMEPTVFPHGDKYGGVRDFAGNIWYMVTHQK